MGDIAIKVEGLSKQYRLGSARQRYGRLTESFSNAVRATFKRGRDVSPSDPDLIWALKDVLFEVKQGDVLGIIGRNGAGKTTLLRILSRITEPTTGYAELRGRVGSLLEVGTGFHPELTGRENVYLNGAILGMRRNEIRRKFDDIVAFAEVDRFIDTPVKRYSSGMQVRLAFAVAAHLEPEILVLDEVLAVGDAAFQKRCLGKMGEVAKQGRTVLFVSHNSGAILRLCSECIWLDDGRVREHGPTAPTISAYLNEGVSTQAERRWESFEAPGDHSLALLSVRICQPPGQPNVSIDITKPFEVEIMTEASDFVRDVAIGLRVLTDDGYTVLHTSDLMKGETTDRQPGRVVSVCQLPSYALNVGSYLLSVAADVPNTRMIFAEEKVLKWNIEPVSAPMGRYLKSAWSGVIGPGLAAWTSREVAIED